MAYESELRVAVEAVIAASRLCRVVQARLVAGGVLQKGDKSPVTVADHGAQAVVSHLLARAFPTDPLVGEEDSTSLPEGPVRDQVVAAVRDVVPELDDRGVLAAIDRGGYAGGPRGRHWTLDPIDGTKGFLRMEQYAVALALIEDGEVVLGVLGCPSLPHRADAPAGPLGCVFSAARGGGAQVRHLDGPGGEARVRVSEAVDARGARFCESVEKEHSSQSDSARVAELLGITEPPFRIDSQCKYAAVARGDASIYLRLPTRADYVEKIWDHAAGWRVVVEAGGRVTDVRGEPLDFSCGRQLERNQGVVVTNGKLHDRVIDAVREVLSL